MPMIKIILFELTRILLGYASDKVGEFIRNRQRSEPPSSFLLRGRGGRSLVSTSTPLIP